MVNNASRRLDCGLDAECLRARAVRAERYSYLADPRDQSAGVARDEYTLLPDARSTTWPERAPAASDPAWARSIIQLAQDLPAAAYAILKGRFHAHAPRIFLHLSTPSALIDFRAAMAPHSLGPTRGSQTSPASLLATHVLCHTSDSLA